MNYKKVYVAGPFFTSQQLESMYAIENVLYKHNIEMFRPRFDAGQIKNMHNASNEDLKRVFNNDLMGIDNSDAVIANLTYQDTGTSFELGYACAKHIPVILFNDESVSGKKINLMLAAVANNYFNSLVDFDKFVNEEYSDVKEKVNGQKLDIE